MSEKYLLLRVADGEALRQALRNQRATLIEQFDPAEKLLLAELVQALRQRGLVQGSGLPLLWCLFEDDKSVDQYLDYNEVECCFGRAWLEALAEQAEVDEQPWFEAVAAGVARWPLKDPARPLRSL